jgi:hypothetical protein
MLGWRVSCPQELFSRLKTYEGAASRLVSHSFAESTPRYFHATLGRWPPCQTREFRNSAEFSGHHTYFIRT